MSAKYTLGALYPNQNISINVIPEDEDYLLLMKKKCPRFDYIMLRYMNETTYKDTLTKNQTLIHFLEYNSGERLETISAISDLYDTLSIEQQKNKM